MKVLPWFISVLLIACCINLYLRKAEKEVVTVTKVRTEVRLDTVLIPSPLIAFRSVIRDTIRIGDTVVNREVVAYKDSLYTIHVSGYRPRIDKLELYPRTVIRTVTNDTYHKPKRWGFGVQAGYGYPNGFYLGAGVSYNLWAW